ncbi:MAG: glycosyltransferase family 4 protein [Archaeoglobaceae archaeon]
MEIVYVYDAVFPWVKGGVEKRIYEVGRRLVKEGFRVKWLCVGWWGKEKENLDGIELIPVCKALKLYSGDRRSIRSAFIFAMSLLKKARIKADLIDCQVFPYLSVFPFVRRKDLVLTWHEFWGNYWDDYLGKIGFFGKYIEKIVASLDRKMIAVSETTARAVRGLGVKEVEVIPNGIDFDFISSVEEVEAENDIVFAGRLIKEKGVDLLIGAMRSLPDHSCLIVGDGPERETLESSAPENVKFLNFLGYRELIATLKSSKVFVIPSRREGFGITALEANACGLPVVTVDYPMNAVVEIAEKTGFVAKPNATDLAEKIEIAIRSRNKMKEKCINYARNFDWDVIAKRLVEFYDQCYSSNKE